VNDPHVESLIYRMKADPLFVTFDHPPPLEHEAEAFRPRLEDGVLKVAMKEHHATRESARTRVEDFLTDWVTLAAIDMDRNALSSNSKRRI
jgi:hypothetical protein